MLRLLRLRHHFFTKLVSEPRMRRAHLVRDDLDTAAIFQSFTPISHHWTQNSSNLRSNYQLGLVHLRRQLEGTIPNREQIV